MREREAITEQWDIGDPSISVVGERFCNPYEMKLLVKRERENFKRDRFEVLDLSGNHLLTVDGGFWHLRRKRLMRDAAGLPVLTMRSKGGLLRNKWKVYEGESRDSTNLLFSLKEPNLFTLKTLINVFLPKNSTHNSPDFEGFGRYINSSFKLFKANNLLAEVNHDFSLGGVLRGNYSFKVKVNPNVDYAFVVALLVIVDDITNQR